MRKTLNQKNLASRPATRALLALSLAATFAAVGCTSNHTPGAGMPIHDGMVRTVPTARPSGGSETPTPPPLPPPMMSSYSRAESLPGGTTIRRLSADEAAAIMAQRQRVRVLGPSNPGPAGRAYVSDRVNTANYRNPALITNPQVTVNSTISSPGTAVITDGAGAVASDSLVIGTVTSDGAILSNGTVATPNGSAAPTFVSGTGTTAPTSSVSPSLTPGAFAGSTAAVPTVSSGMTPPTTTSPLNSTNAAVVTSPSSTAIGTTTTGAISPVRVTTGNNGRVTVTNTTGTTPSKQQ